MLEPTDRDGNTVNSQHIRCRGIPTYCAKYKADQDNIIVWDTYNNLYGGEVIEFDLINQEPICV